LTCKQARAGARAPLRSPEQRREPMRTARHIPLFALLCLVLAASPALAGTDRLKLNLSAWPAALSGEERVDGGGLTGTSVDLQDTLGLDNQAFPELHVALKLLGPVRLLGSYYTTSYEGEETLTQSVTFNGTTYSSSEQVSSQMDLDLGRVLFSLSPVNFKRVNLGLMLGADLLKVKSGLSSSTTGQEQKDFTAPVPVVGVNLTLQPIDKLVFYVEASGMSVNMSNVDGQILDGIARVEFYFLPWFAITGGYRFFNFDVTHDTYGRVNIDQKGAQLGLAFRL
jgi:hypothetical protein